MTMMISKKSNKCLPLADISTNWPGVKVCVTQTGFDDPAFDTGPYGFNLGTHVGDRPEDVDNRRGVVQHEMGAPVVWLNQVHGCHVFDAKYASDADSSRTTPPLADASVSVSSDVALAVMTADCLPVVFVALSRDGKALGVAAAHAGWRGLHAGVLQASVKALSRACTVPSTQIKAWMGPAIGPESFEVGADVFQAFVQQNASAASCFKLVNSSHDVKSKYLADIYALARLALSELGDGNIEGGGQDTLTDSRWFSHRRGQQQGAPSGRFATLIRLLPEHDA
ncbi:MAG: peptidoglycan editing factor PgeF [Pseudomonadota bacterium]